MKMIRYKSVLVKAFFFMAVYFQTFLYASPDVPATVEQEVKVTEGVKHFGPAWLARHEGVYVLYVEGTDYEMGYQHGVLLRDEIHEGFVPYMDGFILREIEHSMIGGMPPLVMLAKWFMDTMVLDSIAGQIPEDIDQGLRGLAEGSGYPYSSLRRVLVYADAGQAMQGMVYGKQRLYPDLAHFTGFGCSSFAASGPAAKNGHMIHGRNFDWPGANIYENYQTVIFCKPASGQRYAAITTAGLHTAGATAMNESGLVVGFHTGITADTSFRGMPILPLCEMVVRRAAAIEDAVEIFRKHPTAAGWMPMVSEAKTGRAVAVEMTNHHLEVIDMSDHMLGLANSYRSSEMQELEIGNNWSGPINSMSRLKRMNQLLQDNFGRIDPQKGAEFLSDHFDINTGRERSLGDVISQVENIQAVVFDSTDMNFWLATGRAPVCNNRYVGFNFFEGFEGRFPDLPDIHGTWENDPRAEGFRFYTRAMDRYSLDDDIPGAMEDIRKALAADPDEPVYAQTLGLLCLKGGMPEQGEEMFTKALSIPQTSHKQSIGHLWLARGLDLAGRREQAVKEYQKALVIPDIDPRVREAALGGIRKPYTFKEARRIKIEFAYGDTYGY